MHELTIIGLSTQPSRLQNFINGESEVSNNALNPICESEQYSTPG